MYNNRHKSIIATTFLASLFLPTTVFAYIGPGAGLSVIGTVLALIAAFFLAIVGFVWYPVRRMLRRKHASEEDRTDKAADTQEEDGPKTSPSTGK